MEAHMKKIALFVIGCLFFLTIVTPAHAVSARAEVKKAIKTEVQEKAASRPGLLKKFFERAAIGTGKVTAVSGATLTVEKDGKSYTVVTDEKTQFRRRFWGKGALAEIAVGHTVNVIGQWADDAKTTINARLVRDTSIQKRLGVFFGNVLTVASDGWTMTTIGKKRDDQTVKVSATTKFVNRKGEAMTQAGVVVGHRVRVRGLWDRTANTITEVTEVKDFTLPVIAPTATPTP